MRSWFKGNEEEDASTPGRALKSLFGRNTLTSSDLTESSSQPPTINFAIGSTRSLQTGLDPRKIQQNRETERNIAQSARRLCDRIDLIVSSVQEKGEANDAAWKEDLITLFGGTDDEVKKREIRCRLLKNEDLEQSKLDMNILFNCSSNDKFTTLCINCELPTRLIHCLRLFRILELHRATDHWSEMQYSEKNGMEECAQLKPLSMRAVENVGNLMALLLNESVAEQIRPHLFGLLVLSSHAYPLIGSHVGKTASNIVRRFSESCLTPAIIWFLHAKKMIVRMTDDVKELIGLTSESEGINTSTSTRGMCAFGQAAERDGMWISALFSIISVVTNSCSQCADLLDDFVSAGGYIVLHYGITHSSLENTPQMLELAIQLSRSKTSTPEREQISMQRSQSIDNDGMLVKNFEAFQILIDDLSLQSIPFLADFLDRNTKMNLDFLSEDFIQFACKDSVHTALSRDIEKDSSSNLPSFEISSILLNTVLQLYSSHSKNFKIVESRYFILSRFLLAFPTFKDFSTKVLILKTLDFVFKNGSVSSSTRYPITVALEIFFALSVALLSKDVNFSSTYDVYSVANDLNILCDTIENILENDEFIIDSTDEFELMDEKLNVYLPLLIEALDDVGVEEKAKRFETSYICMCRILRPLVSQTHVNFRPSSDGDSRGRINLNILVSTGIKDLSQKASQTALFVMKEVMDQKSVDTLEDDIQSLLQVAMSFAETFNSNSLESQRDSAIRETDILNVLADVMNSNHHSRPAFQKSGGFDVLITILKSLKGCFETQLSQEETEDGSKILLSLVEAIFSLLSSTLVDINMSSGGLDFELLFYSSLARVIGDTAMLTSIENASRVLNLVLSIVDDSLSISKPVEQIEQLRNAEAMKLVLSLVTMLPTAMVSLSESVMLTVIKLCSDERFRIAVAKSGLVRSMTSTPELTAVILNEDHMLHRYVRELLEIVASFSMTSEDFSSFLRCIGIPILQDSRLDGRVNLPVIVSSVTQSTTNITSSKIREENDASHCEYLQIALKVAENEDKITRFSLGGSSLDKLAFYMQDVPFEQRIYKLAEDSELSFIEIPSVYNLATSMPGSGNVEELWQPSSLSGFSVSIWVRIPQSKLSRDSYRSENIGTFFLFDIHTPPAKGITHEHISCWYDMASEEVNISTTYITNKKGISFPASSLGKDVWHHLVITYSPSKRSLLGKKSQMILYVDGRTIGEVKVDQVNLPSCSRAFLGCCNSYLLQHAKKYLRGPMPIFEVGMFCLFSKPLTSREASAAFFVGPEFEGECWGDSPERHSLKSTRTLAYSMMSSTDGGISMTESLESRELSTIHHTTYSLDSLDSARLYFSVLPNELVFNFRAASVGPASRVKKYARTLSNNVGLSSMASSDAVLYGKSTINVPNSFSNNLRWIGGPSLLLPIINNSCTSKSLSLSLDLIRSSCENHIPNLEYLQSQGGYSILALLLQQKKHILDEHVMNSCFSFAVKGFDADEYWKSDKYLGSHQWLLADVDALTHLLFNGQVWDYRIRSSLSHNLIALLTELVSPDCVHSVFNAHILHQCGILRWVINLMFEAVGMFDSQSEFQSKMREWKIRTPLVVDVSNGNDDVDEFLGACRDFLAYTSTHWLTRADLVAITGAITSSLTSERGRNLTFGESATHKSRLSIILPPSGVLRVYLIQMLQDVLVEIIRQIYFVHGGDTEQYVGTVPLSGTTLNFLFAPGKKAAELIRKPSDEDEKTELENRVSMREFCEVVSPQWFILVLEHCSEEASACFFVRLLILTLQAMKETNLSQGFIQSFQEGGSFLQFHSSIPTFSHNPTIIASLIAYLIDYPICNVPNLAILEVDSLREMFVTEDSDENANIKPSPEVFDVLSTCIIRNVYLSQEEDEEGERARKVNLSVLNFMNNYYKRYHFFKRFCHTDAFVQPFVRILFALHREHISVQEKEKMYVSNDDIAVDDDSSENTEKADNRNNLLTVDGNEDFSAWTTEGDRRNAKDEERSSIINTAASLTPTDLFLGDCNGKGLNAMIIRMLHVILSDSVFYRKTASTVLLLLFRSIPGHATTNEVEMYQLMLLERSRIVVDDALLRGGPKALANCSGFASVILDRLAGGFFRAEAVLLCAKGCINTLKALVSSRAQSALGMTDQSYLVKDMMYLTRLVCICSLQKMRPSLTTNAQLSHLVLESIAKEAKFLLLPLVSSVGKSSFLGSSAAYLPPSPNSDKYEIWLAASVARSCNDCNYPDLTTIENPDRTFVLALVSELYHFLSEQQTAARESAVQIMIALLQKRKEVMADILTREVVLTNAKGEQRKETVDLAQRGGFGALLAAHDSEKDSGSVPRRRQRRSAGGVGNSVGAIKYEVFYEWCRKNDQKLDAVFQEIHFEAAQLLPDFYSKGRNNTAMVIRKFQSNEAQSVETNFVNGSEVSAAAQLATELTIEGHDAWKQRGFDDIAYGAMKWKLLLRQLKGPFSLWEWHSVDNTSSSESIEPDTLRWKLDLLEGHERQRRRLLQNYEFSGLYLIAEEYKEENNEKDKFYDALSDGNDREETVESVSALLKEMKIKRILGSLSYEDLPFDETSDFEKLTSKDSRGIKEVGEDIQSSDGGGEEFFDAQADEDLPTDFEEGSEANVIIGMLESGDFPKYSYNISRCTGLDVKKSILLGCRSCLYVIDGFELADGDLQGKINRVECSTSTFKVNFMGSSNSTTASTTRTTEQKNKTLSNGKVPNQTSRCQRIAHEDLYSIFKRRYQLEDVAMEIFDVHRRSTLVAFSSVIKRDEFLSIILKASLPNSIFHAYSGGITSTSYSKIMASYQAKVKNHWLAGKMTNFDFIMNMNTFAGRSYNDLTQYPVFPWVLKDYESEELNLNDPSIYRDLSKPMGGQSSERAAYFKERYEELEALRESDESNPPPFHYGTHYSCAGYVLYYLMRLEPFSRLALQLQGGKFDVADRLFRDVGSSWRSAAMENPQDVRELIPEFFYLPDFLINNNSWDFGCTQGGIVVNDVFLPKWSKGDPKRFIRIHRQALESEYVSRNLHQWIDLIFGYKQRGIEAKESLNLFIHVTYEDYQVDLNMIEDPLMREATINQVQNFGQTPSRITSKPFPNRIVYSSLRDGNIDLAALPTLKYVTPPLCIVGAPHRVFLKVEVCTTCNIGTVGQIDSSVGDLFLWKDRIVAIGKTCRRISPKLIYLRFGSMNNGVTTHDAVPSSRFDNNIISSHDALHSNIITAAAISEDGRWLVTGSTDSTVRVWRLPMNIKSKSCLQLKGTLFGHSGGDISCVDICTIFGVIVTAGSEGVVLMWDLRTRTFLRQLKHGLEKRRSLNTKNHAQVKSISINQVNGNVVVLVGSKLNIFDINGYLIATFTYEDRDGKAGMTCVIATACPEWMEDGVVAVTGHKNGDVRLWGINCTRSTLLMRHLVPASVHSCPITCLRVCGECQDVLLIGDASGKASRASSIKLESLDKIEKSKIVDELAGLRDDFFNRSRILSRSDEDFELI